MAWQIIPKLSVQVPGLLWRLMNLLNFFLLLEKKFSTQVGAWGRYRRYWQTSRLSSTWSSGLPAIPWRTTWSAAASYQQLPSKVK